jgi:histidinol phosphatase-like enzyme
MFIATITKLDGTSYTDKFDEWSTAEGLAKHLTKTADSGVSEVIITSSKGTRFGVFRASK